MCTCGVYVHFNSSFTLATACVRVSVCPAPDQVGDRVLVGGQKVGTVQFSGPTKFASGCVVWCVVWCGCVWVWVCVGVGVGVGVGGWCVYVCVCVGRACCTSDVSVCKCPYYMLYRWWFGIELDEAKGKNDGAVNGVRYFTCPSDRGIFAPPHRLTR